MPKLVSAMPLRPLVVKMLPVIAVSWIPPCKPSKTLLWNVLSTMPPKLNAREPRFAPVPFAMNTLRAISGARTLFDEDPARQLIDYLLGVQKLLGARRLVLLM